MIKILENFSKPTIGRNCLWASIESVLNYMGIQYMEHEIYFMCDGMDIKFTEDGVLGHEIIAQRLGKSNLNEILEICSLSCPVVLEEIYNVLLKNTPIICVLQAKNMRYHKDFSKITHSRRHTVVLYGINTETGQAYISDRYFIDVFGKYHVFYEAVKIDDILPYLTEAFYFKLETVERINFNFEKFLGEAIDHYVCAKAEVKESQGNVAWINYFDYILSICLKDNNLFYSRSVELSFLIKNVLIVPSLEYLIRLLEFDLTKSSKIEMCISKLKNLVDEWSIFSLDVIRRCFRGDEASCLVLSNLNKEIVKKQITIFEFIRGEFI